MAHHAHRATCGRQPRTCCSDEMSQPPEGPLAAPPPPPPAPAASMRSPRRIKLMRPAEIAALVERDARLIVPVGTCEQHGPHLPLGCDTLIVERLGEDLSAEFDVLLAPTIEYGVNVVTERGFAGNASMRK